MFPFCKSDPAGDKSTPVDLHSELAFFIEANPSFLWDETQGLPALLKSTTLDDSFRAVLESYAPHTRHKQATAKDKKKSKPQKADLFDLQYYVAEDNKKLLRKENRRQLRNATYSLILSTLEDALKQQQSTAPAEEKGEAATSKKIELKQKLRGILWNALAKEQTFKPGATLEFADILRGLQNNLEHVIDEYQWFSKLFKDDLEVLQKQKSNSTYHTTTLLLLKQQPQKLQVFSQSVKSTGGNPISDDLWKYHIMSFLSAQELTMKILPLSKQMHPIVTGHRVFWGQSLTRDFRCHDAVVQKLNPPQDEKNDSKLSGVEVNSSTLTYEVYTSLSKLKKANPAGFRKLSYNIIDTGLFYPPLYCEKLPETKEESDTQIIRKYYLQEAAELYNFRLVQWLIDKGRGKLQVLPTIVLDKAAGSGNFPLVKYLVEDAEGPQLVPTRSTKFCAAESGNLALIKFLLQWRAQGLVGKLSQWWFSWTSPQGMLTTAAGSGNLALIEWLFEWAALNRLQLIPDQTTLMSAARSGNLALVEYLLQWPGPNGRRLAPIERTLFWAVRSGNLALVKFLLQWQGPNGLRLVPTEEEMLLYGAVQSDNFALVKWLVEDAEGPQLTPTSCTLNRAAKSGSLDLVQWLIAWRGPDGDTLLDHYTLSNAAESGNLALVKWLVWDAEGPQLIPTEDTLNNAAESGNLALVKWLVEDAEGPRLTPTGGALNRAARSGNLALVKWLVWDAEGPRLTPTEDTLDEAAQSGNLDLVKELLQWRGPDGLQRIPTGAMLNRVAKSVDLKRLGDWSNLISASQALSKLPSQPSSARTETSNSSVVRASTSIAPALANSMSNSVFSSTRTLNDSLTESASSPAHSDMPFSSGSTEEKPSAP